MPRNDMGKMNIGWGICGFTSSLYALYEHNPTLRSSLAKGGKTGTRVLAEIKTYLRILQAEGETTVLSDIEKFTKSFGGKFANFTVDSYIESINEVVTSGANPNDDKYSVALPPGAVVDYLKRVCQFKDAKLVDLSAKGSEFILGVCGNDPKILYGGLEHYLYYLNGTIYSWGKTFTGKDLNEGVAKAAAEVKATWTIGYKIAIGA